MSPPAFHTGIHSNTQQHIPLSRQTYFYLIGQQFRQTHRNPEAASTANRLLKLGVHLHDVLSGPWSANTTPSRIPSSHCGKSYCVPRVLISQGTATYQIKGNYTTLSPIVGQEEA